MQKVSSRPRPYVSDSRSPISYHLLHVFPETFQICDLLFERVELGFEHGKDTFARSSTTISRPQNLGQFREGKSKLEGVSDHLHPVQSFCRIYPVARLGSRRLGQHAKPLVVAKRVGTDARFTG